jgi:hypothetical protein
MRKGRTKMNDPKMLTVKIVCDKEHPIYKLILEEIHKDKNSIVRIISWEDATLNDGMDGQLIRIGKHEAGRMLDLREWNEMPKVEVPA